MARVHQLLYKFTNLDSEQPQVNAIIGINRINRVQINASETELRIVRQSMVKTNNVTLSKLDFQSQLC